MHNSRIIQLYFAYCNSISRGRPPIPPSVLACSRPLPYFSLSALTSSSPRDPRRIIAGWGGGRSERLPTDAGDGLDNCLTSSLTMPISQDGRDRALAALLANIRGLTRLPTFFVIYDGV